MRAGPDGSVIIRADAGLAQKLALASDSGTLWFLLRPAGNAKEAAEAVDHEHGAPGQISGQRARARGRTIRALVAVEGLDVFDVQRALPDDPSFELVGMTDGVDETVRTLQNSEVDVLLVACQGREDDRSLQIIDGAHRHGARRADHRPLGRPRPTGSSGGRSRSGAADMALFPQSKEQLRFAMSKAIARRPPQGDRRRARRRAAHLRPRARRVAPARR